MPETTPSSSATWLADRALLRVGGAEARAFLNGLVTQDVLTLAEGQPRWAGLLSPQVPPDTIDACRARTANSLHGLALRIQDFD